MIVQKIIICPSGPIWGKVQEDFKCESCYKSSCDYCGKTISGALFLKRHIDKHNYDNGPKNHKCDTCGKSFSKNSYLQSHIKNSKHELEGDQYEDLLELIDGKWTMRSI